MPDEWEWMLVQGRGGRTRKGMRVVEVNMQSRSSGLGEADDLSVLSEAFAAQQQVVLADETDLALASSALAAVLAEFTGMSSPEQVWHLWQQIIIINLLPHPPTYTCPQLYTALPIFPLTLPSTNQQPFWSVLNYAERQLMPFRPLSPPKDAIEQGESICVDEAGVWMAQGTLVGALGAASAEGLAAAARQHQVLLLLALPAALLEALQHRLQVLDLLPALSIVDRFGVGLLLFLAEGLAGDVLLGVEKLALLAEVAPLRPAKKCAGLGLGLVLNLLILHQYYKIGWERTWVSWLINVNRWTAGGRKDLQEFSFRLQVISMEGERNNQLPISYEEYEKRGCSLSSVIIDKYVIYDEIGKGSYGKVYRGMDDETKKQVAVKVIDLRQIARMPEGKEKRTRTRLAQTEPELMQICQSNYVLKCYHIYKNHDLKVLILEFCNGKTLHQELQEKHHLPESEAIIIIRHIINGLMEMHRHKIVHRDLKAENIMNHNGTYKIIDLGFSKKLEIAQESMEVKATALGTITTMAPEVMSKQPYGLKADIWSLGIIFHQMIYGVLPYDSLSAKERFREISEKKIFASKEPPTYKGVTPSQAAYDFMRFLIVVDSKLRPDWKQVSEHPLIRNIDDEFISQRFLKQCDVNADSDLNYEETITENNSAVIQPEPEVTQEFKGFLQKVSGIADSKKPHSQHYPEELSNRLNSQNSPLLPKGKTPKQQEERQLREQKERIERERAEEEEREREEREKEARERAEREEERKSIEQQREAMRRREEIQRQSVLREQEKAKLQEEERRREEEEKQEIEKERNAELEIKKAFQRREQINKQTKQREKQEREKSEREKSEREKSEREKSEREKSERKAMEEAIRKEVEEGKKIKVDRTVFKVQTGQKKEQKSGIVVQEMNSEEMKRKEKDVDNGENEEFAWASKTHLECLKTQFIYREIIMPIESGEWLRLSERSTVEFMYLLTARCFNNMSPIQHQLEVRKQNKEMISNLNGQITPLYSQVREKFTKLSQDLTKVESKPVSIVSDFFSRKLWTTDYATKEKFLSGIEGEGNDYLKEEQIDYTVFYYKEKIQKELAKLNQARPVMLKLDNYSRINAISLRHLAQKGKNFQQCVDEILRR